MHGADQNPWSSGFDSMTKFPIYAHIELHADRTKTTRWVCGQALPAGSAGLVPGSIQGDAPDPESGAKPKRCCKLEHSQRGGGTVFVEITAHDPRASNAPRRCRGGRCGRSAGVAVLGDAAGETDFENRTVPRHVSRPSPA